MAGTSRTLVSACIELQVTCQIAMISRTQKFDLQCFEIGSDDNLTALVFTWRSAEGESDESESEGAKRPRRA